MPDQPSSFAQSRDAASPRQLPAGAPGTAQFSPISPTRDHLLEFLDVTPSCIVGIDHNFCFRFANRAAMHLLGQPDLLGQSIWKLFPGNLEEPFCSSYRRAMEQRVTTEFEAFYPEPLNCWFKVTAHPVQTGILIVFDDVTARKRSQEALAASEERYRILADLNPQAIWMGGPDGSITYANQGFLDYIGLSLDGLDGDGWLQGFDPRDRDEVVAAWIHSVHTGDEYNVEARIIRARDGAFRLWSLRGLPVRDEAGAILHWLGVAMDIHEARTHAEELQLKQQETERQRAELENIYQSAAIGLALFSPDDFRFLRTNGRLADMVGLPPEQIVGRTLAEIAPTMPHLLDIFRTVADGTAVRDIIIEGELPGRPGEHRVWNASYTPVFAPDGSVEAITGTSLEITHQKKAEAALIQSEKLAAVGRLASSISHEINNPLEAITNLLYLVALADNLPQELKVYVHMAQSELSRVSQIATQSLRFHRQAIRPTLVTAADLVNPVILLYQGRLANSGITVDTQYASNTQILCLENDIRQVLNNLIANSIDAMRTGGRLIARAHAVHHPVTGVSGVRIAIADTGHGMSAATRARIFEPFYTTKDLSGTGLGLWISAGIIDRHQGSIRVRSSEHPIRHGTLISLFLPCQGSPGPADEPSLDRLSLDACPSLAHEPSLTHGYLSFRPNAKFLPFQLSLALSCRYTL